MAAFHSPQRVALAPRLPGVAAALGAGGELVGRFLGRQAAAGDRDALLHQRPNFLGLGDRGDDAALDLGLVVVVLGVALGEEQRAGQAAQQGPLMARDCGRACGLVRRCRMMAP